MIRNDDVNTIGMANKIINEKKGSLKTIISPKKKPEICTVRIYVSVKNFSNLEPSTLQEGKETVSNEPIMAVPDP